MKIKKFSEKPIDIDSRIGAKPIVCYPNTTIEDKNLNTLHSAREHLVKKDEVIIPPRDAKTFEVKFGEFFRIESVRCLRSDTQASKYLGLCQYVCTGHPHVERV